ncbi:sensor histidine kinase [Novosphingobium terrae]|uniref:sensor histidine kinase n=1 Tax=Novosphingobium terrae TaxID=2726189 RepID=UPI00197D2757|nr:HAMP domain-containing sensor histidine kinase [Novosphingobium terrae]
MLLGITLLIAQAVNFGLILNERQKLSLARNEAPAIARFAATAADAQRARSATLNAFLEDRSHRGTYFDLTDKNDVAIPDDPHLLHQTADALSAAGASWRELHVASQIPYKGMPRGDKRPETSNPHDPDTRGPDRHADEQVLRFALERQDGRWVTARIFAPRRDPYLTLRLLAATIILYGLVLAPSLLIASRITRSLRALTRAAETFQGQGNPPLLVPGGPHDIARAMEAFNAMSNRVIALLDDKDRMLGAIGHDLRTPLASLRLRLEQMQPPEDREAAIGKIEQIADTLDDILTLARTGRSRSAPEKIDLGALAEAVVEDQIQLGRPVSMSDAPRHLVQGHPEQLRRALYNLIENAVTYGQSAKVEIARRGTLIELSVSDQGQGIPAGELEAVMTPFYRRDPSRAQEKGGSGLGLPIARSIAQSHNGSLILQSEPQGGLRALLIFPAID